MRNTEKELQRVSLEFVRKDLGIMLLDMIDTARRDNKKQGRGIYDDYDYRYAAAVVASAFGFKSRSEWTTRLKELLTEYQYDVKNDTDHYFFS